MSTRTQEKWAKKLTLEEIKQFDKMASEIQRKQDEEDADSLLQTFKRAKVPEKK
jgi:hypothetical protein